MPSQLTCRHQSGASLIEVLVAMLLMSIGVLAMTAMQAQAIQHSQTTEFRAQATLLAHDLADRMRANAAPHGDWSAYDLTADAPPASLTGPSTACQGSVSCAFPDMAAADLAEWQQQLSRSLPHGRGHVRSIGPLTDLWVIWDEPDHPGAQAHDPCPAGLTLGTNTRCLYARIAL